MKSFKDYMEAVSFKKPKSDKTVLKNTSLTEDEFLTAVDVLIDGNGRWDQEIYDIIIDNGERENMNLANIKNLHKKMNVEFFSEWYEGNGLSKVKNRLKKGPKYNNIYLISNDYLSVVSCADDIKFKGLKDHSNKPKWNAVRKINDDVVIKINKLQLQEIQKEHIEEEEQD